ncbi:hypothetical protein TrLO_g12723 [Triparma laevis f. longispina]|uniref:Peptidase S54 rhomboid domain-containing protein n=1 Tax=Triparma laevis f. longispina TaxID=1714387 RepID=A0A9W6ZGP9_9STRA|nr:hypothetical protein TrLO_g12723 [Triparma laevis f. longispina]
MPRQNTSLHTLLRDMMALKLILDFFGINIMNRNGNDPYNNNTKSLLLDKILMLALASEFLQALGEFFTFPVTNTLIMIMIYLHFEYKIRGKETIPNNNYNKNALQTNAVLNGEYHRIWTSVLVHGSNMHLFLNTL